MSEIKYPKYRQYVDTRVRANDAMMAFLAGSNVAADALRQRGDQNATLIEAFPSVQHVGRFNVRISAARTFLQNADYHLASVAIPYALATHEEFVVESIDELISRGLTLITHGKQVRAWNMHSVFFETLGASLPTVNLELFDVVRETRNCITHRGGNVDKKLIDAVNKMSLPAVQAWQKMNNNRPPSDIYKVGKLDLTSEHIFSTFAIAKKLGRDMNGALLMTQSMSYWAEVAVMDFGGSTARNRNSSQWRRGLIAHAKAMYSAATIPEVELEKAARGLSFWTRHRWND